MESDLVGERASPGRERHPKAMKSWAEKYRSMWSRAGRDQFTKASESCWPLSNSKLPRYSKLIVQYMECGFELAYNLTSFYLCLLIHLHKNKIQQKLALCELCFIASTVALLRNKNAICNGVRNFSVGERLSIVTLVTFVLSRLSDSGILGYYIVPGAHCSSWWPFHFSL